MRFAFAAILLLAPLKATAQDRDLASIHYFNGMIEFTPKVRLMLHSRVRYYNDLSDFYQVRAGPIVFWDWKRRWQWQAGYYWLGQRSGDNIEPVQRPWAGVQVRAIEKGRLNVDWRNLIERHMFRGPEDFTRFRSRAMMNFMSNVGWQPYASAEALALKGTAIGRYTAGMNYATAGGHLFGAGYEFRQEIGHPGSHFIGTMVQFRLRGPKERQKPGKAEVPE